MAWQSSHSARYTPSSLITCCARRSGMLIRHRSHIPIALAERRDELLRSRQAARLVGVGAFKPDTFGHHVPPPVRLPEFLGTTVPTTVTAAGEPPRARAALRRVARVGSGGRLGPVADGRTCCRCRARPRPPLLRPSRRDALMERSPPFGLVHPNLARCPLPARNTECLRGRLCFTGDAVVPVERGRSRRCGRRSGHRPDHHMRDFVRGFGQAFVRIADGERIKLRTSRSGVRAGKFCRPETTARVYRRCSW